VLNQTIQLPISRPRPIGNAMLASLCQPCE
jgi:hypothetical protein